MDSFHSAVPIQVFHTLTKGPRENLEDVCVGKKVSLSDEHPGLRAFIAVADGMGGHARGELASHTAVNMLENYFISNPNITDPKQIANEIPDVFNAINKQVRKELIEIGCDEDDFGTTLTCIVVIGNHAVCAHVGDSSAFILRSGKVLRITKMHIDPDGGLVNCIGNQEIQCEVKIFTLAKKDVLFVCSDGLTDVVDRIDIESHIINGNFRHISDACTSLVRLAEESGTRDNVSVAGLEYGDFFKSGYFPVDEFGEEENDEEESEDKQNTSTTIYVNKSSKKKILIPLTCILFAFILFGYVGISFLFKSGYTGGGGGGGISGVPLEISTNDIEWDNFCTVLSESQTDFAKKIIEKLPKEKEADCEDEAYRSKIIGLINSELKNESGINTKSSAISFLNEQYDDSFIIPPTSTPKPTEVIRIMATNTPIPPAEGNRDDYKMYTKALEMIENGEEELLRVAEAALKSLPGEFSYEGKKYRPADKLAELREMMEDKPKDKPETSIPLYSSDFYLKFDVAGETVDGKRVNKFITEISNAPEFPRYATVQKEYKPDYIGPEPINYKIEDFFGGVLPREENGKYYWRIRGEYGSQDTVAIIKQMEEFILSDHDDPPVKPEIISPNDGSSYSDQVTFKWYSSDPENEPVTYTLIIEDKEGNEKRIRTESKYNYEWNDIGNEFGNIIFYVIASDGENESISEKYTLTRKYPTVTIIPTNTVIPPTNTYTPKPAREKEVTITSPADVGTIEWDTPIKWKLSGGLKASAIYFCFGKKADLGLENNKQIRLTPDKKSCSLKETDISFKDIKGMGNIYNEGISFKVVVKDTNGIEYESAIKTYKYKNSFYDNASIDLLWPDNKEIKNPDECIIHWNPNNICWKHDYNISEERLTHIKSESEGIIFGILLNIVHNGKDIDPVRKTCEFDKVFKLDNELYEDADIRYRVYAMPEEDKNYFTKDKKIKNTWIASEERTIHINTRYIKSKAEKLKTDLRYDQIEGKMYLCATNLFKIEKPAVQPDNSQNEVKTTLYVRRKGEKEHLNKYDLTTSSVAVSSILVNDAKPGEYEWNLVTEWKKEGEKLDTGWDDLPFYYEGNENIRPIIYKPTLAIEVAYKNKCLLVPLDGTISVDPTDLEFKITGKDNDLLIDWKKQKNAHEINLEQIFGLKSTIIGWGVKNKLSLLESNRNNLYLHIRKQDNVSSEVKYKLKILGDIVKETQD